MYQSCMSHGCGGTSDYFNGWPSYMIDTASIRSRALEWLSFAWGVTGELYWESTWAYTHGDPWVTQYQFSGNGDGNLFYPGTPAKIGGTTHIPVASLRMKMLREGMEDYEYLKLLSDAGDPTLAHTLATTLFPNAWTEPSISDLLQARETIANRIVELTGGAITGSGTGTGSGAGTTNPDHANGTLPSGDPASSQAGSDSAPLAASAAPHRPSGCSTGLAADAIAGLAFLVALAARRRRR
jgi:MYXO-CTERM domain-containing protein